MNSVPRATVGKKKDLLSVNSNANNKILRNINKELAKLEEKLGLNRGSSDGESSD
jgi:hypothetical protein